MIRAIGLILFLIASITVSGCVSNQKEPAPFPNTQTFTAKQMEYYQVAVMPVVSADTQLLKTNSQEYGTSLANQLKKQFPTELTVVTQQQLSGALHQPLEKAASYYFQHGVLPLSTRAEMTLHLKQVRYLFMVKVNEDKVLHKMTSNPITNMVKIKGKRQLFNTYITIRDVSVTVSLYDLFEQRVVWENSGVLAKTTTQNKRLLIDEDKVNSQHDASHYPNAATLNTILPELYRNILQTIPKE